MEIELKGKRICKQIYMNTSWMFVCHLFVKHLRNETTKNCFYLCTYFDVVYVCFVLFKSIKSYIVFYLSCGTRFWCKSSGLFSGYNLDEKVSENRTRLFDYTIRTLANSLCRCRDNKRLIAAVVTFAVVHSTAGKMESIANVPMSYSFSAARILSLENFWAYPSVIYLNNAINVEVFFYNRAGMGASVHVFTRIECRHSRSVCNYFRRDMSGLYMSAT